MLNTNEHGSRSHPLGVPVTAMLRSIEAIIDREGHIQPLEEVHVPEGTHAIITFLPTSDIPNDTAYLSEAALGDWNRPEEEEAWAYLQKAKSS